MGKHASGLDEATCNGCGKPILWGRTADDKRICLDPRPPIYRVLDVGDGSDGAVVIDRDRTAYVSHFATCQNANLADLRRLVRPACPGCNRALKPILLNGKAITKSRPCINCGRNWSLTLTPATDGTVKKDWLGLPAATTGGGTRG